MSGHLLVVTLCVFLTPADVETFTVMRNPFISEHLPPLAPLDVDDHHLYADYSSIERMSPAKKWQREGLYTNPPNPPKRQNEATTTTTDDDDPVAPPQSHCRCTCVLKPGQNAMRSGRRRKDGPSEKKWLDVVTSGYEAGETLRGAAVALKPPPSSSSSSSLSASSSSSFSPSKVAHMSRLESYETDEDRAANASDAENTMKKEKENEEEEEEEEEEEGGRDDGEEMVEKYATALDFSSLLRNNEVLDRYAGHWGGTSRYPYRHLRDDICYRQPCKKDRDCCLHFNLCDKSAFICRDCWYGQNCQTEEDCCLKYPLCSRKQTKSSNSSAPPEPLIASAIEGRCVDKLPKVDMDSE